jgi:hypothetical protein
MESEHDASILCVHSDKARSLRDREGDLILALELVQLHWSREEEVATSSSGSVFGLSSHELVGVEVQRKLVGSTGSLLLLSLGLIEILALESWLVEADTA